MDLLTATGVFQLMSLITNSSWLPWGRVAMPLISPLTPVPLCWLADHNRRLLMQQYCTLPSGAHSATVDCTCRILCTLKSNNDWTSCCYMSEGMFPTNMTFLWLSVLELWACMIWTDRQTVLFLSTAYRKAVSSSVVFCCTAGFWHPFSVSTPVCPQLPIWVQHSHHCSLFTICGDACPLSCVSAEACLTGWPNARGRRDGGSWLMLRCSQ